MIISMKLHSTKEEIEQVCERIRDFGYKIHAIEGGAGGDRRGWHRRHHDVP